MENRAKLRFPRTLFSPFASCKAHKLISDVFHLHHHGSRRCRRQHEEHIIPHSSLSMEPLLPPPSARRPAYSSLCKPRCPDTLHEMVRESCILSVDYHKLSGDRTPSWNRGGWMRCPPASPVSPITPHLKLKLEQKQKGKEKRRKHKSEPSIYRFSSSYEDWFSSDDEREGDDETESETESPGTLFSSSTSSSRSISIGPNRTRRKPPSARRREARKKMASLEEKVKVRVKRTFAVVKRSSDPFTDFRASMAEMIMDNNIFHAGELEQLLQGFLSLNSPHHHNVIVEVFAEICDALFFNRFGL